MFDQITMKISVVDNKVLTIEYRTKLINFFIFFSKFPPSYCFKLKKCNPITISEDEKALPYMTIQQLGARNCDGKGNHW